MLSVLIPIYNHDTTKLVAELARQCAKANVNFQILCFDDGSKEKYKAINQPISSIFGVSYLEFQENIGRSKIRNKLGFNAMYENLLFLDCDSSIPSKKFIKKYVTLIDDYQVIYGGRKYKKAKPRSVKKMLHWTYGVKKEAMSVESRIKKGNLAFQSNNFLIKRKLFLENKFDEQINQYGHEDTLLALELENKEIRIKHVENPVEHKGLETTDVFLNKTSMAIENLVQLENKGFIISTSLTRMAQKLKKYELLKVFDTMYKRFEKRIYNNLYSDQPNMIMFSIYKLNLYLGYKANNQKLR